MNEFEVRDRSALLAFAGRWLLLCACVLAAALAPVVRVAAAVAGAAAAALADAVVAPARDARREAGIVPAKSTH